MSFTVNKGEHFVLLGSNNSGTSAVIKSLLGLNIPTHGSIRIQNVSDSDLLNYRSLHGIVGYQPQTCGLDDSLTVTEHLRLFAKLAGCEKSQIELEVTRMIEACVLLGLEHTIVDSLSHGQVRRLSLGCALIGKPPVIILDNPLHGVDPPTKKALLKTIQKFAEGSTLIVATRDLKTAQHLGHKIGIMHKGEIVAIGSAGRIIQTHGQGLTLEVQTCLRRLGKQA